MEVSLGRVETDDLGEELGVAAAVGAAGEAPVGRDQIHSLDDDARVDEADPVGNTLVFPREAGQAAGEHDQDMRRRLGLAHGLRRIGEQALGALGRRISRLIASSWGSR